MPDLDFEAWATIAARLVKRTGVERQAILDECGMTQEDWEACNRRHNDTIVEDVIADRADRRSLYAVLCVEELERRRVAGKATPKPAIETTQPAEVPVERPVATAIPSFLLERRSPEPIEITTEPLVIPPKKDVIDETAFLPSPFLDSAQPATPSTTSLPFKEGEGPPMDSRVVKRDLVAKLSTGTVAPSRSPRRSMPFVRRSQGERSTADSDPTASPIAVRTST